jgi:hypothetical protein
MLNNILSFIAFVAAIAAAAAGYFANATISGL